jgi:hypothetical protein
LAAGKKILVVGPNANLTDAFIGDYRPAACAGTGPTTKWGNTWCQKTGLMAISEHNKGGSTLFAAGGCKDGPPCTQLDNDALAATVAMAKGVDAIVLVQGLKTTDDDRDQNTNGEGRDRSTIALPGDQANITRALMKVAAEQHVPLVVVLLTGGSISVDGLKGSTNTAVISAGFGGEAGGEALADVLFGAYNPSGRLAHTMYAESW